VSLLDYYRQFEAMSREEVNAQLRERATERWHNALTLKAARELSEPTSPDVAECDPKDRKPSRSGTRSGRRR
jgi:hypothetical protein